MNLLLVQIDDSLADFAMVLLREKVTNSLISGLLKLLLILPSLLLKFLGLKLELLAILDKR